MTRRTPITMDQAIEAIDQRFRSGNSVPVQKATIPADEWQALKEAWRIELGWIRNPDRMGS